MKIWDGIRRITCYNCGLIWDALCYFHNTELECPDCGTMVHVDPVKTEEPKGQENVE